MSESIDAEVIVVLGGNLVKDGGIWRTTTFDEHDDFGCMGDSLRVIAASVVYKRLARGGAKVRIVASGGRGQSLGRIPGVPTVAEVIAREVTALGIVESDVLTEESSGNTYQQLRECDGLFEKFGWRKGIIISNRYHLPRVNALLKKGLALTVLPDMLHSGALVCESAEAILLKTDSARWKETIQKAYAGEAMKARIALEEKGVQDIKKGTYAFV